MCQAAKQCPLPPLEMRAHHHVGFGAPLTWRWLLCLLVRFLAPVWVGAVWSLEMKRVWGRLPEMGAHPSVFTSISVLIWACSTFPGHSLQAGTTGAWWGWAAWADGSSQSQHPGAGVGHRQISHVGTGPHGPRGSLHLCSLSLPASCRIEWGPWLFLLPSFPGTEQGC